MGIEDGNKNVINILLNNGCRYKILDLKFECDCYGVNIFNLKFIGQNQSNSYYELNLLNLP